MGTRGQEKRLRDFPLVPRGPLSVTSCNPAVWIRSTTLTNSASLNPRHQKKEKQKQKEIQSRERAVGREEQGLGLCPCDLHPTNQDPRGRDLRSFPGMHGKLGATLEFEPSLSGFYGARKPQLSISQQTQRWARNTKVVFCVCVCTED